jgi:hypothetical protein
MNVAGAVSHRLRENGIDQADDRRLGVLVDDVLGALEVVGQASHLFKIEVLDDFGGGLRPGGFVETVEDVEHLAFGAQDGLYRCVQELAHVVEREQIVGVAHRHQDGPVFVPYRNELVLTGEGQRDLHHQGRVEFALGQFLPEGQAEMLRLGLQEFVLVDQTLLQQRLFEGEAFLGTEVFGLRQLVRRQRGCMVKRFNE